MLYRKPSHEILEDLRNALKVLEENSHMGLDDKAAESVRATLLRQIAKAEEALTRESAAHGNTPPPLPETPE
jgi:hypothetical protein